MSDVVKDLLSMGYRLLGENSGVKIYAKPFAYSLLTVTMLTPIRFQQRFKGNDGKLLVWNSATFDEKESTFLEWLKYVENWSVKCPISCGNDTHFEFLTLEQQLE